MSFKLDDFLHKPQLPELATKDYFNVVHAVAPQTNPPHAVLRTVEQLAKGLLFDHLVNVGDTPSNAYLKLAKVGVTSASPYIPYTFIFKDKQTKQASLTGTYSVAEQNVLPSNINRAINQFHQKVKFDVDFINNNTVKQVALIELSIPYSPGLSLGETISLFKDTFATFMAYPQLSELYRKHGYAGSQLITSVTTNAFQAWNCSCKVMLVMNAFNEADSQTLAQEFADEFTNVWVNAIASVTQTTDQSDLYDLANLVASDYVGFTFHAFADNIIDATPNVNQQLFGLEHFIADNQELIMKLDTKDIVNGSLQVPEFGNLTPCQLLRLACNPNINPNIQTWCVDKWLEYVGHFVEADAIFLPDQYYQYVLEYGRDAWQGTISQARQDYFFDQNLLNNNELIAKLPINLFYTIVNPCILDSSLLNLAERQPQALAFYMQLLLDLHNNALALLVDEQELETQGKVSFYLPAEWLALCGQISQDLIGLAVYLSAQETLDLEAPLILEKLQKVESKVNEWIAADFYRQYLEQETLELSPRRQVLQSTFVTYERYDFLRDVALQPGEPGIPTAILAADVFNLAFDTNTQDDSMLNTELTTLSPTIYAQQVQDKYVDGQQVAMPRVANG